jgi:hypothetical protein
MIDEEKVPRGVNRCDVADVNDASCRADDIPNIDTFDCIVDASAKFNVKDDTKITSGSDIALAVARCEAIFVEVSCKEGVKDASIFEEVSCKECASVINGTSGMLEENDASNNIDVEYVSGKLEVST